MKSWTIPTIALAGLLTLGGCATSYKYDNQTYSSEAEALAGQQKANAGYLAAIPPTSNPVGGTLRVYIPNQEVGREVFITGNRSSAAADYLLKARYADFKLATDLLVKRAIFDKVEVKYDKGEHREAEADAYVLYTYASRDGDIATAGWYFVTPRVPRTPVNFDTAERGIKRLLPYLDSVEGLARVQKAAGGPKSTGAATF